MFDFNIKSSNQRLAEFAKLLLDLSAKIGFRVSSRGWCYILEQSGAITKDKFNKVETWVNRCRRKGFLPIDFVAEEDARRFHGVEKVSSLSPIDDLTGWLDGLEDSANYYGVDWWRGERYYIQMVVEKIDLVTLFRPICTEYHIPIANAKGWSSMLQRAEYARRFLRAEENGLECILLYCGDHDPDGLRISDFLRKNLRDLRYIGWADGIQGYNPETLRIERFGLNCNFIEEHGFTWIDNLITGSGKNLAVPSHKNHSSPYVQEYLEEFGERKCEANVLVTEPEIASTLCRESIEIFLRPDARQRFRKRRRAVRKYMATFFARSGMKDLLSKAREYVANGDDTMTGETWFSDGTE